MEFIKHDIEWTDKKVSRLWDYYSSTPPYNNMYFTGEYGENIIKIVRQYTNLNGQVLLDFGSGAGHLIDEVDKVSKPAEYYALDFSPNSIDIAKKKHTQFPINTVLVNSFPSSIKDNSIDVCFFIEVIEHLNDEHLRSSLNEIYRVLKPNGILLITTPNDENLNNSKLLCPDCGCLFHKWQHQRAWNKTTLQIEMRNYNFKTKAILETNLKPKGFLRKILQIFKNKFNNESKNNLVGIFSK